MAKTIKEKIKVMEHYETHIRCIYYIVLYNKIKKKDFIGKDM